MKADPGNDHRSPPPPPAQNRSSHAAFSVGKYLASIPKWPNIWHRSRHATILSSPSKKKQRFIYGLGKQAHYLDERVLVVIAIMLLMIMMMRMNIVIINIRVIWIQWRGQLIWPQMRHN